MAYAAPNLYQPTFENTSPIASALKAVGGLQGTMQGGMETQYLPQQLQAALQTQQQGAQQAGIETKYLPAQMQAEIKNLMSNAGLNQAQAASVTTAYHLFGPEYGLDLLKTGLEYPKQMLAGGGTPALQTLFQNLKNYPGSNNFYSGTMPSFQGTQNQNPVQQFAKQNNLNESQIDQLQNGQIVDLGNGRVAQNYNGKIRTGRRQ